MKKTPLIATVICAALLSGCSVSGDPTELGSRAVVEALAVDYAGKYRACALVFSSGGGSNTIDPAQENVIKVAGEGETLAEAVDNISLADGKKMYMAETKLLVLGGGFGKTSAADALDTLYYDLRCSLNMPVCCAENAELITDMHFTEGITSAEKPIALIENAHEKGVSPKTTLLDLLSAKATERDCQVPMLKPEQNGWGMTGSEDNETAVLCGSRKYSGGIFGDILDEDETVGELILTGKTRSILLNYFSGEKECTCAAKKIHAENRDGKWIVTAKLEKRTGGELPENEKQAALNALAELVRKRMEV